MEMGSSVGEVTRQAVVGKKTRLHTILQPQGADVRFLEIKEFEQSCGAHSNNNINYSVPITCSTHMNFSPKKKKFH